VRSLSEGFSAGTPPTQAQTVLAEIFQDSEKREIAWGYLREQGRLSGRFSTAQVQTLVAALLPYVDLEPNDALPALASLAQQIGKMQSRDKVLYEQLGVFLKGRELDSEIVYALADPFTRIKCHNIDQEPDLLPWRDLFVKHADTATLACFLEEALHRVRAGQFSSYHHLVSVVRNARDPGIRPLLEQALLSGECKDRSSNPVAILPSVWSAVCDIGGRMFAPLFASVACSTVVLLGSGAPIQDVALFGMKFLVIGSGVFGAAVALKARESTIADNAEGPHFDHFRGLFSA